MLKKIVLIVLALAILGISLLVFFIYEMRSEKLQEKVVEISNALEEKSADLAFVMDDDANWLIFDYDYGAKMAHAMSFIDSRYMTFGAAYTEEAGEIVNISARFPSYEGSLFDPLAYAEFLQAIEQEEYGVVPVWWAPDDPSVDARDMYIIYRWTEPSSKGQFLLVSAVSEYTVQTPIANYIPLTVAIYIFIALIACVWIILIVARYFTEGSKAHGNGTA